MFGAFVLLVLLVGANLVAIRYSNRELAPFWNAGLRFALAAVGFGLILAVRRPGVPERGAVVTGTLFGLLSFAGFFGFIYLGLVQAPVAIGQTVLALNPLVTMFIASAIGMERLHWRAVGGAVISLIGVALAIGAAAQLRVPIESLLELAAATTSFALGALVVRRAHGVEPITLNFLATAIGATILLSISAVAGEPWLLPSTPGTWLAFLYLVGPGTIVVFMLFLYVVRAWSATALSYQFVLAPIVAITLAAILLGESVGLTVLIGAGLVILGVYVGAVHRRS